MKTLLIIGDGPSAWSCAITAQIRNLQAVVIGSGSPALLKAKRIDNYPGFSGKSGQELWQLFRAQALKMGAQERSGIATLIMPNENGHTVLVQNEVMSADAIVLCTGASHGNGLRGEHDLVGNGVSYCATCDGRFYTDRRIAVLSEGKQGILETHYLQTITKDIHYYSLQKHDTAMLNETVSLCAEAPVSLERNVQTGKIVIKTAESSAEYDGVFIFRTVLPTNTLLKDLAITEEGIAVDRQQRTNIPGIFAAGDCTGMPHQLPKAIGEGNIAAIAAAEYLSAKADH